LIPLGFLWIAWCCLHSLLISLPARKLAARLLGGHAEAYRILYALFSTITLTALLLYQWTLPQSVLVQPGLAVRLVRYFLLGYGLVMFYLGARVYDMPFFLGITQWRNRRTHNRHPVLPFRTDGVLAWVRHPWYSGGIALIWGFGAITDVYLLTRTILTIYLLIGARLEEKKMEADLEERYAAYRRSVPMLLPRPPGRRRPGSM
jgi:methanethiol S-methyltransferase